MGSGVSSLHVQCAGEKALTKSRLKDLGKLLDPRPPCAPTMNHDA
jgi:hypothetical protein